MSQTTCATPGLTSHTVYRSPLVLVSDCVCRPRSPSLTPEESACQNQVVLVRTGTFVHHIGTRSVVADPATVLFFNRDEGYRVSHPVPGGDRCTTLALEPETLLEILADNGGSGRASPDRPFPFTVGPVDPTVALLQRRMVAYAPFLNALEIDEMAIRLVAGAVRARYGRAAGRFLGPAAPRHKAVQRARLFIAAHFRKKLRLPDIAREAAYSPYHLCRVFKEETGLSIHRHVNRLRLMEALDALESGTELSPLAHGLGFSSHSHFSTAFRREFGTTPQAVRSSLTARDADAMRRYLQGNGYAGGPEALAS